ncbi:SRPBCC family protein [Stenotrophomonas sp. W1S232]|jgi:Polyketide cyclase / dehydrase and lipid transport.|uniref:Polyketide cyclase n=1 Tax=Stenotrophomonas koreensis TaxID=266128 RepID=A0A0R0C3M5_9GAMM|nr:SRPBCC family protein [Stenotrophomonas koreensis]KRG59480.1 polyketide cyclase [Stenotrophomonas koreensis]MBB1117059.1 SRPBCC family protein [Stenotrophomonas koreensis]
MTRIIEFLIALGIVAILFVIIGVCLPGERHISESIETNRKMTIVNDTVNSLRRFKDWNPLVLRDPAMKLSYSGPASGVGARMEYDSAQVGQGSWEITQSEENQRVVYALDNSQRGSDKTMTFLLEPTGKDNRNVKITQEYSVKYGFDLFGRYAGLYVSRHVGDDIKLGLGRLQTMLAGVPNIDYRDPSTTLADLGIVDLGVEDLLVVNAGNIERGNETIRQSIKDNQEWIKRVMDNNGLEAAGPVRIITTDFGAEKYAFDVAQPVRKKGATEVAADELSIKVDGTPVTYSRLPARKAAHATYVGHMAGLDVARSALRSWATTNGHELIERPYESWNGGLDKSFTQEGDYDIYWAIK